MKQTWIWVMGALLLGIVGAWVWVFWPAFNDRPPANFDTAILVQEIMSVQGNETTTTVFRDGRIVYEPSTLVATSTEPRTYHLTTTELAELKRFIIEAGPETRRFQRDPGVVYEGTYRLRTNLDEYREHTTIDAALEKIPTVWEPYTK